ncbi:MAG TPA: hypothetical protein VHZ95_22830, partial [Polyangiales bacterium]|nr:hypothetical protein [Polyangiales bacterium]
SHESTLLDTGRTNATLSTVGYIAAIGGAALGTVFYFTFGRASDSEREHADASKPVIAARVGLGAAELAVTF